MARKKNLFVKKLIQLNHYRKKKLQTRQIVDAYGEVKSVSALGKDRKPIIQRSAAQKKYAETDRSSDIDH